MRWLRRAYLTAIAALLCAATVFAQPYPNRPIRFVVPFGPGGATDIIARSLSRHLADAWAQSEIVRILKVPEIQESYARQGFVTVGSTPQQFAAHINDMIAKYRRVVKDAGIKME